MNLFFADKEYRLLFLAVPILLFLFWRLLAWKKRTRRQFGQESLFLTLISEYSHPRFSFKWVLLLLAFVAGVLGLMNLSRPDERRTVKKSGVDLVIALDISRSMLAQDIAPSRLEKAKQFIYRLLETIPDDRVALVLFAGNAYLQMPLTNDHAAAALYVAGAVPEAIPQQGTVISRALEMAAGAFPEESKGFKSVLLITDGEGHDAGALAIALRLRERGVMINTVGIGSSEGTTIPDLLSGGIKKDPEGKTVITRLNEELLGDLSAATNGRYIPLQQTAEAVTAVRNQLAKMDSRVYADRTQMEYRRYYPFFVMAMLILLITELFVSEKRKTKRTTA